MRMSMKKAAATTTHTVTHTVTTTIIATTTTNPACRMDSFVGNINFGAPPQHPPPQHPPPQQERHRALCPPAAFY